VLQYLTVFENNKKTLIVLKKNQCICNCLVLMLGMTVKNEIV